jgi:HEAT repeat protein
VRALAAWALGRANVAAAAQALAGCMTDESWWVRRHAAYALAHLGRQDMLAAIAKGSDDPYAREIAQEVLDVTGVRSAG